MTEKRPKEKSKCKRHQWRYDKVREVPAGLWLIKECAICKKIREILIPRSNWRDADYLKN